MTNETRQRLLDVLISCEAIDRYTAGLDFAAYERDTMVQDAVERRLEQRAKDVSVWQDEAWLDAPRPTSESAW
jgi:hypothetical protein